MSLLLLIMLTVFGVLYVRRRARRMFANFSKQMDPYREAFDKAAGRQTTANSSKQVFDGQFEEVHTTKK
ncbi:hypothetical protein JOC36_000596 [Weissella uvarum]|uniref:hypothetical protein n=1 Tax=Weissella uvarum TaxID=1479233 RepID=UPI001960EFF2|nr:hypothetical protein [Weissella uvarum]MBM7617047.1 hypothetical protein [Weissella uvarum]MCM0595345.1 hypothetical protein [Weissella uvarum]